MTRQEFIEDVTSFGALIMFCQDHGIDYCDDIYDAYCINDYIMETIGNMRDWERVREYLQDIPAGVEYYRENGSGEFEDADYFFDDYKDDVLKYMDENGGWDSEDEDDEDDEDDFGHDRPDGADVESEEGIESRSFMAILRG